jgi:hypothetical protein
MSDKTILATISNTAGDNVCDVRVKDYKAMIIAKDKHGIAEMVYHRFRGRYVKPFLFDDKRYKKHFKHGFAIMASSCLLIEALEAFYNGWEETGVRGNEVFDSFFRRDKTFDKFRPLNFYKHIRCGILHQAEATGGFTVGRLGPLLDDHKNINAQLFLTSLERSLVAYRDKLEKSEWDSEIWDNLRRKMRFVISHC